MSLLKEIEGLGLGWAQWIGGTLLMAFVILTGTAFLGKVFGEEISERILLWVMWGGPLLFFWCGRCARKEYLMTHSPYDKYACTPYDYAKLSGIIYYYVLLVVVAMAFQLLFPYRESWPTNYANPSETFTSWDWMQIYFATVNILVNVVFWTKVDDITL